MVEVSPAAQAGPTSRRGDRPGSGETRPGQADAHPPCRHPPYRNDEPAAALREEPRGSRRTGGGLSGGGAEPPEARLAALPRQGWRSGCGARTRGGGRGAGGRDDGPAADRAERRGLRRAPLAPLAEDGVGRGRHPRRLLSAPAGSLADVLVQPAHQVAVRSGEVAPRSGGISGTDRGFSLDRL